MRTRGATGALKAFFSMSIGPIDVEDMRLLENRDKELFIGFPSKLITRADGTQKWFEIVRLSRDSEDKLTESSKEVYTQILEAAKEEYERRVGEETDDGLPF